jgi:putative drug exporter of the RND superfamily
MAGIFVLESVATGLQATAQMISGAAILMIAVFGAFTITSVLPIQQLGLSMAIAIVIDATIIRLIVVPVSMRLFGDWNWWFPGKKVVQSTMTTKIESYVIHFKLQ